MRPFIGAQADPTILDEWSVTLTLGLLQDRPLTDHESNFGVSTTLFPIAFVNAQAMRAAPSP